MEDRSKSFENPFNHAATKQILSTSAVELRKSKREAQVQKHRNIAESSPWISLKSHYPETYQESDLDDILSNLSIPEDSSYLFVAQAIRKILCSSESSVGRVIDSIIMEYLPVWLKRTDFTQLQYESSWICTNISASEYCQVLDKHGILPILLETLLSLNPDVRYQTSWAISNIVVNTSYERDKLAEMGVIDLLFSSLETPDLDRKKKEKTVWAITNTIRKKPYMDYSRVRLYISKLFAFLLTDYTNSIIDICWVLKIYIKEPEIQNELMKDDYYSSLLKFCDSRKRELVSISLQLLGAIFYHSSVFCRKALEKGFAAVIEKSLDNENNSIKKNVVWVIGNIVGDKTNFVTDLLKFSIFDKIFAALERLPRTVLEECVWAICNACVTCSFEELGKLVDLGAVKGLVFLLEAEVNPGIIFEALLKILNKGKERLTEDGRNFYEMVLDSCNGFEVVRLYVNSENQNLALKADMILNFFEPYECFDDAGLVSKMEEDKFEI